MQTAPTGENYMSVKLTLDTKSTTFFASGATQLVYFEIEKPSTSSGTRLLQARIGSGMFEGWAGVTTNLAAGAVNFQADYNFNATNLTSSTNYYT